MFWRVGRVGRGEGRKVTKEWGPCHELKDGAVMLTHSEKHVG